MDLKIKQHQKGMFGRFYIGEEDDRQAELIYEQPSSEKMVLLHTEVKESLEGMGIAKKLLNHSAAYARKHKITLVPLCPYAKRVMEKDDAFSDVIVQVR